MFKFDKDNKFVIEAGIAKSPVLIEIYDDNSNELFYYLSIIYSLNTIDISLLGPAF